MFSRLIVPYFRLAAIVTLLCATAFGDDGLLFGPRLREALNSRRSLNVSQTPVEEVCRTLQANTKIAIVLDRRIDPSTRIDVNTDYTSTRDVFEAVCEALPSAALSLTDFAAVIGPPAATKRLRTLVAIHEDSVSSRRRQLSPSIVEAVAKRRRVVWDRLSQPREILTRQAAEVGLTFTNANRIPHDLWPAMTLPSVSFSELTTLVLNQFDLSFEIRGQGEIEIVDVPTVVGITHRYQISPRDKARFVDLFEETFPKLDVTWSRAAVTATTTIEVHELLAAMIRGEDPETRHSVGASSLRERKMTFKVPPGTPMRSVIASLRAQGLLVRIDGVTKSELTALLEQTVEFDLKAVPGEEFFPIVFKSWNASVDVQDSLVVVRIEKK